MEFTINDSGNWELRFKSTISIDNGYTNSYQGEYESVMELHIWEQHESATIEWSVGDDDFFQTIGLFFDGKTLVDYDGIFELPSEALKLLRKAGFTAPDSEWM